VTGEGVEIDAQVLHVDLKMGHRLGAVDQHLGADGMGEARHLLHRHDGADGVGHMGDCHQLGARA
jgi:hypothetical protein